MIAVCDSPGCEQSAAWMLHPLAMPDATVLLCDDHLPLVEVIGRVWAVA